jgi:hypothetical protein
VYILSIVLPVVPSRPSRPLGVGVIGGLDRRRHLMGGIAEFWLCDGCVMCCAVGVM